MGGEPHRLVELVVLPLGAAAESEASPRSTQTWQVTQAQTPPQLWGSSTPAASAASSRVVPGRHLGARPPGRKVTAASVLASSCPSGRVVRASPANSSTRWPAMAILTCLSMRRSAKTLVAPSTDSIQALMAR